MKKNNDYILLKSKKSKTKDLVLDCNNSYSMNPKDKSISVLKTDINDLIVYDSKLIKNIIKKKIDKQFAKILEFIVKIYESDDDPSGGLMEVLNEAEKFRRMLQNKYNRYLDKEEKEFEQKKIDAIEKEIKEKFILCQRMYASLNKVEEEILETHHRR